MSLSPFPLLGRYALMSRAESDLAVKRHAVNFLYDAPPGTDAGNKDDGAPLELDKSMYTIVQHVASLREVLTQNNDCT